MRELALGLPAVGIDPVAFSAHDAFSKRDLSQWGHVPVRLHNVLGPRSFGLQHRVLSSLSEHGIDLVHQHGLWMFPSVASLVWSFRNRPKVISPHGMLDGWALRNSAFKKQMALALFERRNLSGARCIHALCAAERDAIRSLGLKLPIAVIPNGVDLSEHKKPVQPPDWINRIPKGGKILLYLGRIHPKKGLEGLIEAMRLMRCKQGSVWHLVIAGWDQGGTQQRLSKQSVQLGLSQRVHFVGPQFASEKRASFRHADAFILPSLSEGLPMAALEAWSFSLPLLMTDSCNLPEGFSCGAAVRITNSPVNMARSLDEFVEMSEADRRVIGRAGRRLVEEKFAWDIVARQMAEIYMWSAAGGQMPDTIFY